MRKLGVYIGDTVHGVEKNTFVWYEVTRQLTAKIGSNIYDLSIWSLKYGYPTRRGPDAKLKTTEPKSIESVIIPIKDVADKYCIELKDQIWRIQECTVHYDYSYDYEHVTDLKADHIGSNACSWGWEGERAMSTLKNAKVSSIPVYKMHELTEADRYDFQSLTMPDTVGYMIKEQLKESLEKSITNSCYGIGGFTTNPDPFKVVKIAEKETKTMTETDSFLKNLNGITITSTYSKLHHGISKPYYIYYPEMEITEDIADTLLTVLLMAKREYIHKVVFNPEKGTTTIYRGYGDGSTTVKCRDGEFDYILGYNMARTKLFLGSDDYNWFNKIKNHRKTHIEYTEPKAKKASKKGGKK